MSAKHGVRLQAVLGGGVQLHVHGVYFDLHDYELVQLAADVLRQLSAMTPEELQAAEAAAASMERTGR